MTHVPTPRRRGAALRLSTVLVGLAGAGLPAGATVDEGLAVVRTVEGAAAVERADTVESLIENGTLASGDRLTTARNAQLEVVLADGTLVHAAGDSDLVLAELAGPYPAQLGPNRLLLARGELLVTGESAGGTRVDTENATVYLVAGSYRLERGDGWTTVITRDGEAEVRTPHGAVRVATGEQAWVEVDGFPVVEPAGLGDALERWAAVLDGRRERLARRWLFYDYGDDDIAWVDDDFWSWDAGAPICSPGHHGSGDAHRTRPPRDPEPGRVAVPVDRDEGGGRGDVEARWTRPTGDDGRREVRPLPQSRGNGAPPDRSWVATELGDESFPAPDTHAMPDPPDSPSSADAGWRHVIAVAIRDIAGVGGADSPAASGVRTAVAVELDSADDDAPSSDDGASGSVASSNDTASSSASSSETSSASSDSSSSSSSNDSSSAADSSFSAPAIESPPPPEREPNR